MNQFADRLNEAIVAKSTPLCVGLDPRWDSLPATIRGKFGESLEDRGRAYEEFCLGVLDVVAPHVAVVKPQSAFFEACGPQGMQALRTVMQKARKLGLITILDAKKNDIASTAEAYAEAAFHVYDADALTVNPYMGRDSLEAFLKIGRPEGRGLFALVRTSNPGACQFQDLECNGRPLYAHVAEAVKELSLENVGTSGFGDVGAVVGATSPDELKQLRGILENVVLLVPGYGAQGASAADTAGAFRDDGLGAIVNSARAILYPKDASGTEWEDAVEKATRKAIAELAGQTPAGKIMGN